MRGDEGTGSAPVFDVSPSAEVWYEALLGSTVHLDPPAEPVDLLDAGLIDPATGRPRDTGQAVTAARMRAAAAVRGAQTTVLEAFARSVRPAADEPVLVRRVHPSHAVRVAVARSHHARRQVRLMDGPPGAPTTAARIRMITRLPVGRFRVLHRGRHPFAGTRSSSGLAAPARFGSPSPIRFLLLDDPVPTAWLWHEPPVAPASARSSTGPDPAAEMLCTTSAPVLRMLRTLFDKRWEEAAGTPARRGRTTDEDVLAALAVHPSDDDAALALGISVRTFARRVHDLMRLHGCATRFQLALTVGGTP
ncbi:hypothetical protein [Micromonospora sp. RP3T]|uniref:hypothetical protein n=1 Tax=Micromonospora sp. RP3T TaxID=2135446 RepID=UPI000D175701|nr:hypothetical protein [Micromonospora sp. RP3T]PTA46518.1 hypothetical protein C8054_09005 [Micromonospora sp. RP3T]